MKVMRYIQSIFIIIVLLSAGGCSEDDRDLGFIDSIPAPSNLKLQVQLSQDNSGVTTLTPSGESVAAYTLDYGDGSEAIELAPGESTTHVYPEGTYTATLIGRNLNGEETEITQSVVVSFRPPENLEVTVVGVPGDNFSVNVSASADFAVGFEVFFGDQDPEEPTPLMIGETITYTYPDVGTYQLRVVALSGGAETSEATVEVVIENPIILPVDFESESIDYAFSDFGGAINQVIDNPDPSGSNTSAKVAEFFKEPGAEIFAGTILQLGSPIDFSQFQGFTMNVWSPKPGITVKLKLENADDSNIAAEVDATTSTTNAWETVIFDFSSADLEQEYSKLVVFLDFGNTGEGTTFYFDNIAQATPPSNQVTLPLDFEDSNLDYGLIGFEGAESAVIANPDPSGINTSMTVVETTKTEGAQFFAGTLIPLDVPIDFSISEKISIKTWSPKAGIPVRLKLEADDPGQFVELDVNTTVANGWEELIWDFSGQTAGLQATKVIIFFEFVVDLPGDGSTYYFDDVQLAADGVQLPIDFEDTELDYEIIGFEGAESTLVANPVSGGINTSGNVIQTIKTDGAQFFAGTAIPLDVPVVFGSNQRISIKTYSPKAGIPVRLKLENGNGDFVELDANTTAENAWEELIWDFTGQDTSPAFDTVVVFFEFIVDLPGDGTTYYFDDIQFAN
ncbi:PKD domain-containing protein [Aureitalea marina]|uniref:PKD/Chitinase domain-containing protein n=1 Tax=Aureitalea marina TaxID=930804 RepID=A0A2S7KS13_9FLAO|nr:PKD domain-containing protein [Aureitalea marina]PQB05422.1 hypothetical protein BST85_11365 [Aureitalea marina]